MSTSLLAVAMRTLDTHLKQEETPPMTSLPLWQGLTWPTALWAESTFSCVHHHNFYLMHIQTVAFICNIMLKPVDVSFLTIVYSLVPGACICQWVIFCGLARTGWVGSPHCWNLQHLKDRWGISTMHVKYLYTYTTNMKLLLRCFGNLYLSSSETLTACSLPKWPRTVSRSPCVYMSNDSAYVCLIS